MQFNVALFFHVPPLIVPPFFSL